MSSPAPSYAWLDAYVLSELTFGPATVAELVELFEPSIPEPLACHREVKRSLDRLFAAGRVVIDFTNTIPSVVLWRLALTVIAGGRRGPAKCSPENRPQHLRVVRASQEGR